MALETHNIDFYSHPIKISQSMKSNKKKGRSPYIYISDEAGYYLKKWLDKREHLMKGMKTRARIRFQKEDKRIFPYNAGSYNEALRTARKKADVDYCNYHVNQAKITAHAFRKFFRSQGWNKPDVARA
jgi:integrase